MVFQYMHLSHLFAHQEWNYWAMKTTTTEGTKMGPFFYFILLEQASKVLTVWLIKHTFRDSPPSTLSKNVYIVYSSTNESSD